MSQPSLTIPLRSSSINAQTSGTRITNRSQENLRCERSSKAHKILGTTDVSFQEHKQEDIRRNARASLKSTKSGTFVPFPSANLDASLPPQHLRVRASSPLLGQEYRSQEPSPPLPKSSKKVHQFGSSSTLFSYFSSKEPAVEQSSPNMTRGKATRSHEPQQEGGSTGRESSFDPRMSLRQAKGPVKESKRKMRPPRIDLSLLFPKPRETAAPLLSPQRLTSSPSQISVDSEYPSTNMKKPEPPTASRRLTKPPPARSPARQLNTLQENDNAKVPSAVRGSKNLDYLDAPFGRTVVTSEFDLALDKYYDAKSLKSIRTAQSGPSVLNSQSPENTRARDPKSTEKALRKMSSSGSAGGWSKETYLSPKTCSFSRPNRISNAPNTRKSGSREDLAVDKGLMSKKSSKSTLRNADLNNSSVLCLSSSEDESDGDEAPTEDKSEPRNRAARDSMITFEEEFDAEICMASSAAQTTRGSTLRRVDISNSSSKRSLQTLQNNPSLHRDPSLSSAGKLSSTTRKSRSRRSSGIPTISEPDNDDIFSQFRNPPLSQQERDRRSRVMAVTRQEEHLLEAVRQRKGKITPSIFQQAQFNTSLEPDQASMLSSPTRDSFYGSHTFLRLSPGLPPSRLRADQGATYHDKDGTISQGAASDAEQRTINSSRASLAYSESLPSPATSASSPLTPPLPIHRFSPLPSQKPPPRRPPPAVPQAQRRHSRRRTDSSEAIVLDEPEDSPENEFPIWALEWKQNNRSLAAVH
ncbi:hypothetical protein CDV55_101631 [Aspergillus turcosus]|uniref:Uncharacterized protein n=1 Tax=Aspergillus turcosus TaxID=1245748 RepID=A0A229XD03_9EURO|nr:hypothetical protein CDV55_101631 [Aspergillus turcosus]RLM01156.1 hypothetical protein CFD26_108955 [Aspergillus turcosus]